MNKKVELLAPAGNMEKLQMALHYGADAVYLGGMGFNLRAGSSNFSNEELEKAVKYAHDLGKKVYVTLNVIPHNEEMDSMPEFIRFLEKANVDGVIVADLGVFEMVRENSNISISISTQASNTNWRSVQMWKRLGARRVVLAREVTLDEIKGIRDKVPDIELEMFVHGAMCMSISGRCLLSNYMTGRDANRGDCAQSCRWKYHLVEETRPGQYMPIMEDDHGSYILSSKDLCTVDFLDKVLETGVDSLKIEGRMKGIYYVSNTIKVYRDALDSYYRGEFAPNPIWTQELMSTSNRRFTSGFYLGGLPSDAQSYNDETVYTYTHKLMAKVIKDLGNNRYQLEIRNRVETGDELEVIAPGMSIQRFVMPSMQTIDKKTGDTITVDYANPNMIVEIETDVALHELDMLRVQTHKE